MLELLVIKKIIILLKNQYEFDNLDAFLSNCDVNSIKCFNSLKAEALMYEQIVLLINEIGLIRLLMEIEMLNERLKKIDQNSLSEKAKQFFVLLSIECQVLYTKVEKYFYPQIYKALLTILPSFKTLPLEESAHIFRNIALKENYLLSRSITKLDQSSLFDEDNKRRELPKSAYKELRDSLSTEEEVKERIYYLMSYEEIKEILFLLIDKISQDNKKESLVLTRALVSIGTRIKPTEAKIRKKELKGQISLFNR